MLRAVFDANVFVGAAIVPTGTPGRLLTRFVSDRAFELVVSPAIMAEVLEAFAHPKVRKRIRGHITAELWFEDLAILADLVQDRDIAAVCSDGDDDTYIAAAHEGRAGFVVTGDGALLAVGAHQGVRIVTPKQFRQALGL